MNNKSYWLTQDQIDDLLDVLVNGYMYSEENEGQRVWITYDVKTGRFLYELTRYSDAIYIGYVERGCFGSDGQGTPTRDDIEECIVYCFLEQWVDIADQRIAYVLNRGGAGRTRVIDFESYASSRGAARFSSDVAAQRLPNTSEGQRRRIAEQQLRVSQANASRRESLRKEYDLMVSRGEIRPPTRIEELQRTARGNPDNASVQAARRLLRKRNIRW